MKFRISLSHGIAAIGAIYMAAIALGLVLPPPYDFIGSQLYDVYANALLHGRFDMPVRALQAEGHYTPNGTGYLYQGLGPLLTRLPFLPFIKLPTTWLAGLSIWFWAVAGNLAYHRAFRLALSRGYGEREIPAVVAALLAAAVWFASPGILLVASESVFYEPVAMAYALGGGFMLLVALMAFGAVTAERALVPLAVLAGLTLHARPHLAVGYYIAVGLLALPLVLRGGARGWRRAGAAMVVLGLFGLLLIGSNALRFQNPGLMHGSFEKSDLQYGMVYWNIENPEGRRARGFREHGQFNAGRILPNALAYAFTPPSQFGIEGAVDAVERLHKRLVAPFGYVRIEDPKVGMLFLWPLWFLLMAIGLRQRQMWRMPAVAGLAGAAVGTLLMLSYATITLRYRVDIWPLVALPAIFGIAPLVVWMEASPRSRIASQALLALLLAGTVVTIHKVMNTRVTLMAPPGTLVGPWSEKFCLHLAARKQLSAARGREICKSDGGMAAAR